MTSAPVSLTLLRQGDTIVTDFADVNPVMPRGQLHIAEGLLTEINDELTRLTALANKSLGLPQPHGSDRMDAGSGFQHALQRLGRLIFFHLFPPSARQRLLDTPSTELFLRLDDQLVHVPWELAFDGHDFLLTKFRVGRQVLTQQPIPNPEVRRPSAAEALNMLIIVDPTESLPAASAEAEQLSTLLDACSNLNVDIMGGRQLRKIDLLQALDEYDLVHYAGHASFDPDNPERIGWVLHDTVLTASELRRIPHPPLLVFSNACQAGATTRWQAETVYDRQAFGIGSAFLLAGSQNYIGTFCAIHDTHSAIFAADFYRDFLQGASIGVALAHARQRAYEQRAVSGLLWASYMHYGNPTFQLSISSPSDPDTAPGTPAMEPSALPEAEANLHTAVPLSYRQQVVTTRSVASMPLASGVSAAPTHDAALARPASPKAVPGQALAEMDITLQGRQDGRLGRRTSPRIVGLGLFAALFLALCLYAMQPFGTSNKLSEPVLPRAYQALAQRDWDEARRLFQQLRDAANEQVQSQGYAGLAAVAFAEGDDAQAITLAKQAQSLGGSQGYGYFLCGQAAVATAMRQEQQAAAFLEKASMTAPSVPCRHLMRRPAPPR